jgi:hypothetical protein
LSFGGNGGDEDDRVGNDNSWSVGDDDHSAGCFFSKYGGGGGEGGADFTSAPLAQADLDLEVVVVVAVGTSGESDARAMR